MHAARARYTAEYCIARDGQLRCRTGSREGNGKPSSGVREKRRKRGSEKGRQEKPRLVLTMTSLVHAVVVLLYFIIPTCPLPASPSYFLVTRDNSARPFAQASSPCRLAWPQRRSVADKESDGPAATERLVRTAECWPRGRPKRSPCSSAKGVWRRRPPQGLVPSGAEGCCARRT